MSSWRASPAPCFCILGLAFPRLQEQLPPSGGSRASLPSRYMERLPVPPFAVADMVLYLVPRRVLSFLVEELPA
ncbi:hypothetical protein EMPS_10781 [Entomortierella parvispora]|uniref:Uncharacterized protein n=1 Tax=Entomortierella parvispora TaxID=205924 RepID=A0A9P3HLJ9_9FUNG|nr:hypothetical protein EMPS_10781 [Entomortierella parvispora]